MKSLAVPVSGLQASWATLISLRRKRRMISGILFLVILKLISAPTWCFVIAWIYLATKCLSFLADIYKIGKEKGKQ